MDLETVKAESKNGVLWIGLNRPDKLNAFNEQMGNDLLEALKEGERSPEARCIVVTGEGDVFSVGEDLSTSRAISDSGKPMLLGEALRRKYNPVIQRIRRMEKPVVAGVNGVVAGAGLGLILACDLRAASNKATFHEAFVDVGLTLGTRMNFWLSRILGQAKAMEVGLGEPIGSTMAMNLGLVNWVFPDDRFKEDVASMAERLARRPTGGFGLAKRALNRAIVIDTDSALEYETYLWEVSERSKGRVEGMKAFYEKRDVRLAGQ